MYFYSSLGTLGQGFGKFIADLAGPVDIGFKSDRFLSAANGVQHGRENLSTVFVMPDLVTMQYGRPEQHAHRAQELHIPYRIQSLDGRLYFFLAGNEIGADQGNDQRQYDCQYYRQHRIRGPLNRYRVVKKITSAPISYVVPAGPGGLWD